MENKRPSKEMFNDLYNVILSLKNCDDCKILFEDLCTNKEVEQMAIRIKAARLLMEGKTFKEITEICDISSATLSRVSKCVQYGEGYNKFLK